MEVQPKSIEFPDHEAILALGPGHTAKDVETFENPVTEGNMSAKIKNTLKKRWALILHKFLIVKLLECEKDDRCVSKIL